MKTKIALFALLASLCALPAQAGPASDSLATCMSDHTSGRDRKDLARWIFVSIAVHPELTALSTADNEVRSTANKQLAALVTKLITETCIQQARAAAKEEGHHGVNLAFKRLGEIAMTELMSHPEVRGAVVAYAHHLDGQKIEAALSSR